MIVEVTIARSKKLPECAFPVHEIRPGTNYPVGRLVVRLATSDSLGNYSDKADKPCIEEILRKTK